MFWPWISLIDYQAMHASGTPEVEQKMSNKVTKITEIAMEMDQI
jgi:hypothetical protein